MNAKRLKRSSPYYRRPKLSELENILAKSYSDVNSQKDSLVTKKKKHLNCQISPFDRLISLPQEESPSYFPPHQRENIKKFLNKDTVQLGNTYHKADPLTPEPDHSEAIMKDFNSRKKSRLKQREMVHRDSVVLGLERNLSKPQVSGSSNFSRLQSLVESGKLAQNLRDELRKHSFKFGDWNQNKLNKSCDTTANQTALQLVANLEKVGNKEKERQKEIAELSKKKQLKSNVPLPLSSDPSSHNKDPGKEERYKTQNTGVFKEFNDIAPEDKIIGVFKQNRAKHQQSRIVLGHQDKKSSDSQQLSPVHQRNSKFVRYQQLQHSNGKNYSNVRMPTKSVELSRIYQQNRLRELPPPRRITAYNVNKRSVITEQWIKERRSSHAPTTSNEFYSRFEAVPQHVRQRDRMVASVMKKSNILLRDVSGHQERYFSQKETIGRDNEARSSSPEMKVHQNFLNTIDQEYVKRANFQRFQSQIKNSNFQQNVSFGREEKDKDSVYRKTFHGSNSSSILEGVQRNKTKQRQYSKREQASQFKLGLRDAGMMSEKQFSFLRIQETPEIAKHNEVERRTNLLKDQEDHVGQSHVGRRNSGQIIKGDRGPFFKLNSGVADTVGMSGKNYRHMMSSESQKLTGGSNTASLQAFSENRGMPKDQRDLQRQAQYNFREAKKIKDACYRSQVHLSGSKKGDYETSYATLYKWKAPRAFI